MNPPTFAVDPPASDFFYPLLFLMPGFESEAVQHPPFRLARRKWETSTFDLATLATKHRLHLPYQAMDVFLSRCNMELCVSGKRSLAGANEAFQNLRVALYSSGVSPFLCPFVTTYSINEYSGINSRDSEMLKAKIHPGMEVGLRSDAGTLEAWPIELSFECITIAGGLLVTDATFSAAVAKAAAWERLLVRAPQLRAIVDATVTAPMLGNLGQSLLHIWSGLEALFPSVSTEVTFRIALYITQLTGIGAGRLSRYEAVTRRTRHPFQGCSWIKDKRKGGGVASGVGNFDGLPQCSTAKGTPAIGARATQRNPNVSTVFQASSVSHSSPNTPAPKAFR